MTSESTANTNAVEAIKQAEAAWLAALVEGENALISLMLEDSRVVHNPVGMVDDRETWARFHVARRRSVAAKATELEITVRGNTAITTCFHEMSTILDESLAPFPMQEVVTKVWEETAEGWRLAHMVMGRRFPPV
ncbi:Ketosteroid isomerase homolog [Streptomyces sp. cf124]|uniref:nuclear transport factor 2 family protein n=1 Tax=Streptomyces TaxID=1883 RepID=UPI0008E9772D|nr:nuclear transport factor 2 family protein [Streptomyces sp. cf124]SFM54758.1 Ketosteroid isomerase homolog [Streptomyces sp. cf124]